MKFAILAPGKIAHMMAKTVTQLEEVECYAVASRSYDRAEAFAKQWNFAKAYGSYEKLAEDPEVELVYIASPHSHHYEHAKLCLEHGKHVLLEKAFTVNAAQAEEIRYSTGESDNWHDLMVAQQKANISLQYTVAVKNTALEAYRTLMNMQM